MVFIVFVLHFFAENVGAQRDAAECLPSSDYLLCHGPKSAAFHLLEMRQSDTRHMVTAILPGREGERA